MRAGLCSATSSGWSQSWGRAHFHVHSQTLSLKWTPSSSAGHNRCDCSTAPQWHNCSPMCYSWTPSAGPTQSTFVLPQVSTGEPLIMLKPLASINYKRVQWQEALTPHIDSHAVGGDNSSVRAHHRGGPTLKGKRHFWTPGRSPSRHVLPSLAPPLSPTGNNWLYCFSHPPQEPTSACSSKSPQQKHEWFDLMHQDDLGDLPQLSVDLASFLEQPEGATDECQDAQSSTTPMAKRPLVRPGTTKPKRVSDQQHSTTIRGARPRSRAASFSGPTMVGDSCMHIPMPDPIKMPRSGSGHTVQRWGCHPTGGWSSLLCTLGVHENSHNSWPGGRLLTAPCSILRRGLMGSPSLPHHPIS